MGRHRGVFRPKWRMAHEALKKNKANDLRRMELLAEILFNDELRRTYFWNGFTESSNRELSVSLLRINPGLYQELLQVWCNHRSQRG